MTLQADDKRIGETVAKGRSPQIRPRLQDAVRLIVTEGLSQADAAKRSGMTPHSLNVALKKPHVRAFFSHVRDAWMDNRTSKAWLNIAQLADSACSEDVRLKANRTFLEAAGELGAKGQDAGKLATALVQIIVNQGQIAGQLTSSQVSGVIEGEAYQIPSADTSNSWGVGCDESDDNAD